VYIGGYVASLGVYNSGVPRGVTLSDTWWYTLGVTLSDTWFKPGFTLERGNLCAEWCPFFLF